MDSIQLALANIASPPVLAFILGLSLVLVRSQLQIPGQIFDFLSIYLLLAIGIKGGVSLSTTPAAEVWLPVLVAVKQTGQKVSINTPPAGEGSIEDMGIALRKNNPELKAKIETALADMLADGTYEKISMQWIGNDIR